MREQAAGWKNYLCAPTEVAKATSAFSINATLVWATALRIYK